MNPLLRSVTMVWPRLRTMLGDRRGVAAVEFAFIVPVLLCMYLITMEASQAIEVSKKVSRAGSSVADLITQQSATTSAEVKAIMDIGEAVIQPYNRSKPKLEVTAIEWDTDQKRFEVAWSMKLDAGGNAVKIETKGTAVTDSQLAVIGTEDAFFIRVKSTLDYKPVIAWSGDGAQFGLLAAFSKIGMGETFYLRPRISQKIACSTCP